MEFGGFGAGGELVWGNGAVLWRISDRREVCLAREWGGKRFGRDLRAIPSLAGSVCLTRGNEATGALPEC